jgi:hypothetical protein
MQAIKCTCIIPSLCQGKNLTYLRRCLNSLIAAKTNNVRLKIIVVSNNRGARLDSLSGRVDGLIKVDESFGFAKMNNEAIDRSLELNKSDYHLLINDDAWVEKDFFKVFVETVKKSRPDLLISLIYTPDKKVIDSYGVEYFKSGYAKNNISFDVQTTLAPAACLLIKSSFLKQIKKSYGYYFNPLLHSYLEDVELSIRAKAIGASLLKNKKLIAYHLGSATYGKKGRFTMFQTYRNILWLIILTWPAKIILKHLPSILLVQGWMIFCSLYSFGPLLYLQVLADTLRNLKQLLRARKMTIAKYHKSFNFNKLFSKYAFRTYHGVTIRIQ